MPEKTRLFELSINRATENPMDVSMAGFHQAGRWKSYSSEDVLSQANACSAGLLEFDLEVGEPVIIASESRPEWNLVDLAAQQLGGIVVPIYATASPATYRHILEKTGARIAFTSKRELLEKLNAASASDLTVFSFDDAEGVSSWESLHKEPSSERMELIEERKIGTAGLPSEEVDVQISDRGEILCKGPNLTPGYFHRPEAAEEAFDQEGWFHTKDLGRIDQEGFLEVNDRIDDVFKTAGGKSVEPQAIRNRLEQSFLISHALVLGKD